jgi:tyrosyl-tRNA synthetase
MALKKELARLIVTDFHSAEAATKAAEDWARQFQKGGVPENLECVDIDLANVVYEGRGGGAARVIGNGDTHMLRLDKLVREAGLASSNREAATKIKSGSVGINGENVGADELFVHMPANLYTILRLGRHMRKVRVIVPETRQ